MASSNDHDSSAAKPSDDLTGLHVLIVEDSWQVGTGLKDLLQACGADVAGPVATSADAERLIAESIPDVALVDINLRKGELSHSFINRLHDRGINVVVVTGYDDVLIEREKVVCILQKPFRDDLLLAALLPLKT